MSVLGSSSQRNIRNLGRKCKTEGCAKFVTKDGSLGLCSTHYRLAKRIEKMAQKPKRVSELHDDPSVILPVRRNFEWLGSLQESVKAMQSEE